VRVVALRILAPGGAGSLTVGVHVDNLPRFRWRAASTPCMEG
jgi:hypothetical protein